LIAMRMVTATGNVLYYFQSDHLGSTSLTMDANGAEVARTSYYAYGMVRSQSGNKVTDRGYTGQYADGDLTGGLMYYNARYYSPALGKFVSADTIVPEPGNPQAFNRYAYSQNNPMKYNDPTGHDAVEVITQFLSGVVYQWTAANIQGHSLGLVTPQAQQQFEALATNQMESDAFVAGRVVGGTLAAAQGIAEAVEGGGMIAGGVAGGAATCLETIGGGCAAGAAVVSAGAYEVAAGVATAGSGINAAVEQGLYLMSKSPKDRPRNNTVQNKQAGAAIRAWQNKSGVNLTEDEIQRLHREFGRSDNADYQQLLDIIENEYGWKKYIGNDHVE